MPSQQNNQRGSGSSRSYVGLTILIVWFVLLGWAFVNRQEIWDWWKLRSYDPPAEVSALATQTTMNDKARRMFYVNQPLILHKNNFTKYCPTSGGEKTIILGCYHPTQNGIYILAVDDSRLEGVEQVTSAHEMLHAAYDRLSASEKQEVDNLLTDFYQNDLRDERVKKIIDAYKESEPNDVVNEMHSIFGTEIKDLPPALESYYAKYFSNRQVISDYASKYQGEFTSRQSTIQQYDTQLDTYRNQINNLENDLQSQKSQIDSEQQRLSTLKAENNISAYNAGVPGFNQLVRNYNSNVAILRGLINRYNTLVNQRNAVAFEVDQLSKELSTDKSSINN